MFKRIREDIATVFRKDPAARNTLEVILSYPGLHAVWIHRVSNFFYRRGEYTAARLISHLGRFLTHIEIHPGARIGPGFFIDHGSGVVIGETTEIGPDCLIYQGVVLGGTSLKRKKRHPTLRPGVTVGAGAVVLGPVTVGENARIGAGAVVISDIPAGATAVGIPARVGKGFSCSDLKALEHGKLPDPVADAVRYVIKEQEVLEKRVKKIEDLEGIKSHIDKVIQDKKEEILEEFSLNRDRFSRGGGI